MSPIAEDVGQAYVGIVPSLKGFSARLKAELAGELRGLDAPIGQAGHRAGQGFGDRMREGLRTRLSGIGSMLKTGLVIGAAAATAGLGALTVMGLRSAAALEQTQIGIEALLGSAGDAKAFIGELQQFAAKTPFEFAGVADASRRILAFGGAVGITRDEVIPTLSAVGDLVSVLGGSQENIDSVVRALGQISSKGKVSQEELLQLAEALPGFNANAAIAASVGLSTADSMAAITRGEIDATTGINALLDGMRQFPGAAGAMEKQSQTLLGVFSTFKDTIAIALTSAFQPVIPEIKATLQEITPVLGQVIGTLAPVLGRIVATILPLVASIAEAITPILTPLIEGLDQMITALTPALQPLGEALGQIVAAVAPLLPVLGKVLAEAVLALVPAIVALVPHIESLVPTFAEILLGLVPLLPPLGELLGLFIQSQVPLTELISLLAQLLTSGIVVPLVTALTGALELLVDLARPVIEFSDSLEELWQHLKDLGSFSMDGLRAIGQWFADLPGNVMGFLSELPGRLVEWATTALSNVAFAVGFGIGKVLRFFIDLPGKVVEFLKELPGKVASFFSEAFDKAKTLATERFNEIVDFAKALPGRIAEFVKELPGKLRAAFDAIKDKVVQIGKDIVQGVINGIKSTIGGIGTALKDGFNSALDGVKSGLGISSPSKVYMRIGEDTVAGYVAGVEQSAKDAAAAQLAALAPAVASPAAQVAPAPRRVTVDSDDAFMRAAIDRIRDVVRAEFGGDVDFAFGAN